MRQYLWNIPVWKKNRISAQLGYEHIKHGNTRGVVWKSRIFQHNQGGNFVRFIVCIIDRDYKQINFFLKNVISTDRPSGGGQTDCRRWKGVWFNWQTVRTDLRSTDRQTGVDRFTVERQTVVCTRTSLISQNWHLSAAEKRFFPDEENLRGLEK